MEETAEAATGIRRVGRSVLRPRRTRVFGRRVPPAARSAGDEGNGAAARNRSLAAPSGLRAPAEGAVAGGTRPVGGTTAPVVATSKTARKGGRGPPPRCKRMLELNGASRPHGGRRPRLTVSASSCFKGLPQGGADMGPRHGSRFLPTCPVPPVTRGV